MNLNPMLPDDPQLTAYALGELDFEQNARVAETIKGDPHAQATVEEIRALVRQMEEALENEPVLPETIRFVPQLAAPKQAMNNVVRFPLYLAAGLAAACVMVVIAGRPTSVSSHSIQTHSDQAALVSSEESQKPEAEVQATSATEKPVLPMVDVRRRAISSESSDVKPAPLRDDGLHLWRSVTDNHGNPSIPLASVDAETSGSKAVKSYPLTGDALPIAQHGPVEVAASAIPSTDADQAVTARYEVVPVAKTERNSFLPTTIETPLLAGNGSRPLELLKLEIRYKLPTFDLSRGVELPRIDTVVDLAFTNKDFKMAVAAAGLGKALKETPKKGSAYDEILTWTEESPELTEETANALHESLDPVKKPKNPVVE